MRFALSQEKKILVMAPHRDTRVVFRKYYSDLLKAGLTGIYNFPLIVPLAEVSQDLNDNELKGIARALRAAIGKEKFTANEITSIDFPEYGSLFGHRLEIDLPEGILSGLEIKIKKIFSPLVVGSFIAPDNSFLNREVLTNNPAPQVSFRAAAAANMKWKPFRADIAESDEISFKWEIGKLSWLPR